MLALFCLRLACGLTGALLVVPARQVNPRFYRVQFLTILGLTALAATLLRERAEDWLWITLGAALLLAFLGSVVWSLAGIPGKQVLTGVTGLVLAGPLLLSARVANPGLAPGWLLADELTSAALLGAATTAMLMGHSYLIAPTMSLTPLRRLLQMFFIAILVRLVVAGLGLWFWTAGHLPVTLEDESVLWLPLRWGFGLAGPLVLGWMAWKSAQIRSTQSATGILYVAVIFCFLGELTSQLLVANTGCIL